MGQEIKRAGEEIELRNNAIREMSHKISTLQAENKDLQEQLLTNSSRQYSSRTNPYTGSEVGVVNEVSVLKAENTAYRQEVLALKHRIELAQKTMEKNETLKAENADLKLKAENLGKQLLSHLTANSSVSIDLEKLRLENSLLKQNMETLKSQLVQSNEVKTTGQSELEGLKQSVAKLTRENTVVEGTVSSIKRQLLLSEEERKAMGEELKSAKKEAHEAVAKQEAVRSDLIEQMGKLGAKDIENENLREELTRLRLALESAQGHPLGEVESLVSTLRAELRTVREELLEKKSKCETLQAQITLDHEYRSRLGEEMATLRKEKSAALSNLENLKSEMSSGSISKESLNAEKERLRAHLAHIEEDSKTREKELEEAQSLLTKANHDTSMLRLENTGLKQELNRLAVVLDKMTGKSGGESPSNSKYSAIGFKMLEDQVVLLLEENQRMKNEKAQIVMDAERLRVSDMKNKECREEISMLKDRNLYLETELKEKLRENSSAGTANDDIVKRLREEIKVLKEKEVKSARPGPGMGMPMRVVNPIESPVIEHLKPQPTTPLSRSGTHDEKMMKDKLRLELVITKKDQELNEKALKIEALEARLDRVNSELADLKSGRKALSVTSQSEKEAQGLESHHSEFTSKKEIASLKERIRTLEDRERQLIDEVMEKDNELENLRDKLDHAKDDNHNLSMGLE